MKTPQEIADAIDELTDERKAELDEILHANTVLRLAVAHPGRPIVFANSDPLPPDPTHPPKP